MKKEVKTAIDGLKIGMFVSRLDRPWIKTPFMLEGINITGLEDIDRVRRYCNYVYVDIELGDAPHPRYWILTEEPKKQVFNDPKRARTEAEKAAERAQYSELRKTTYETTSKIKDEVKLAESLSANIIDNYKMLLKDLEHGCDLDIGVVRSGVADMVESVVRNPSAMMWIVQIKKADEYAYSRALGTSVWCATFGRHLGLDKKAINTLAMGGLLLDLGKSELPPALLKKRGELSEHEMAQLHSHVDLSVKQLASNSTQNNPMDIEMMQMVASHHERANGSGYPQGLMDQEMPVYGKIAGIVDSYDAMTSERPYLDAGAKTPHEAIAELYELRREKYQAELVEQFIQTVGLYPTGSLVEFNTGEVGVVVEINGLRRLQPTIMLLLDENRQPYSQFRHINLSHPAASLTIARGLPPGAYGINMEELFL